MPDGRREPDAALVGEWLEFQLFVRERWAAFLFIGDFTSEASELAAKSAVDGWRLESKTCTSCVGRRDEADGVVSPSAANVVIVLRRREVMDEANSTALDDGRFTFEKTPLLVDPAAAKDGGSFAMGVKLAVPKAAAADIGRARDCRLMCRI